jgi:predicted O-methyltransferase YrrM
MELRSEQDPASIEYMIQLMKEIGAKVYMEIGCAQLGTISKFRDSLPKEGFAIGLDSRTYKPWDRVDHNFPESRLYLSSDGLDHSKAVPWVQKVLGDRKIDFLLIDGDHHIDPTWLDYNDFSPFVRSGGIIAFHDVDWGALSRGELFGQGGAAVLTELKKEGYEIEVIPGSIGMAFVRQV